MLRRFYYGELRGKPDSDIFLIFVFLDFGCRKRNKFKQSLDRVQASRQYFVNFIASHVAKEDWDVVLDFGAMAQLTMLSPRNVIKKTRGASITRGDNSFVAGVTTL